MAISAEDIVRQSDKLFNDTERTNQVPQWQDISEFVLPGQSGIFNSDTAAGTKKITRVFDSTAIQANHDLAASIHGTLTNPATQWSKLRYKNDALNNDEESVRWLEDTNKRIHNEINESNFDTQVSKNYQAFTCLGTMVLFQEENDEGEGGLWSGMRFTAWHLSQIAIMEDKNGIVDTVFRKFKLTAKQAVEKFKDKVAPEIIEAAANEPSKKFEYVLCIKPRDKDKVEVDEFGLAPAQTRPIALYYVDVKHKSIAMEDGFYEMPVHVTRWSTMPEEVYGRGPGHVGYSDVRSLNKLKELELHAMAKAVNPPMLATQRGILGNLDIRPGKVTIIRDMASIRELPTAANFQAAQYKSEDLTQAIKADFFIDKLLLPPRTETGEMTAFEVAQRLEQMNKVLGPTLSRLNSEFLSPLILRTFKMLLRAGRLAQPPEMVLQEGIDVEINFVNQLARSQQIEEVTNIQSWVRNLGEISQLVPSIVDYIDADGIAKHTAKILGVPETAVTDDKQVQASRQQQAQAAQMQAALEAGGQAADIAAKTQQQPQ